MLTRNEFINEVLKVYDTFDDMQRCINDLRNEPKVASVTVSKEERDLIADKFIMLAKKKIVEEATFSWKMVKAYRDEDGEVRYTIDSFDGWLDEKVDRRDLPEWLSFDDFKEQCCDILYKEYVSDRAAALDRLEKEEAEESEGE